MYYFRLSFTGIARPLVVFAILFFVSCSYFKNEPQSQLEAVARVYDYYLYEEDLEGLVPPGSSAEDSLTVIRNFIDSWVRQKIVLYKAEKNLDDEKKNVTRQLEEYRNSLILHAYETELIRQHLDTAVSDEQITEFYRNHPQNFELKDNIIKVIYLKLNKKSPKLEKVRSWYKSSNKKDREALREYCRQYALNYYLDDSTWLFFDDLLKEIPIKTYDKEQFLQNNRTIEIEDSSTIYFVNIKGFMIRNSLSPLSFERKNIISMILNERKLRLLEEMEEANYEETVKKGEFELFHAKDKDKKDAKRPD